MPKYEYACKSCGEHLEMVQSFADAPLTECPACGGVLRKVFSAPGIAFKGSGFYRTDNRKRRTDAKADGAKADGTKPDGATADSKAGSGGESGSGSSGEGGGGSSSGDSKDGPAKKESAPASEAKPKATEAKTA